MTKIKQKIEVALGAAFIITGLAGYWFDKPLWGIPLLLGLAILGHC